VTGERDFDSLSCLQGKGAVMLHNLTLALDGVEAKITETYNGTTGQPNAALKLVR
jgi:hypothetical protein